MPDRAGRSAVRSVAFAIACAALAACTASTSPLMPSENLTNASSFLHPQSFNGGGFVAQAPARHPMSVVVVGFPYVTGVTSENNSPPSQSCGHNCFTITLSTTPFKTPACRNLPQCKATQQFIYSNPSSASGTIYIYNQLSTSSANPNCPKGWASTAYFCTVSATYSGKIPNLPMTAANLKSVQLAATVSASGDVFVASIGSAKYTLKQKDLSGLAGNWYGVQVDVTGGGGAYYFTGDNGSARFNPGSTVTFSVQTKTGLSTPPGCGLSGTYSQSPTNNLKLVTERPTPVRLTYPSIWFTETNAHPAPGASCQAVGSAANQLAVREGR